MTAPATRAPGHGPRKQGGSALWRWLAAITLGLLLAAGAAAAAWHLCPVDHNAYAVLQARAGAPQPGARLDRSAFLRTSAARLQTREFLARALRGNRPAGMANDGEAVEWVEANLKIDVQDNLGLLVLSLTSDAPDTLAETLDAIVAAYQAEQAEQREQRLAEARTQHDAAHAKAMSKPALGIKAEAATDLGPRLEKIQDEQHKTGEMLALARLDLQTRQARLKGLQEQQQKQEKTPEPPSPEIPLAKLLEAEPELRALQADVATSEKAVQRMRSAGRKDDDELVVTFDYMAATLKKKFEERVARVRAAELAKRPRKLTIDLSPAIRTAQAAVTEGETRLRQLQEKADRLTGEVQSLRAAAARSDDRAAEKKATTEEVEALREALRRVQDEVAAEPRLVQLDDTSVQSRGEDARLRWLILGPGLALLATLVGFAALQSLLGSPVPMETLPPAPQPRARAVQDVAPAEAAPASDVPTRAPPRPRPSLKPFFTKLPAPERTLPSAPPVPIKPQELPATAAETPAPLPEGVSELMAHLAAALDAPAHAAPPVNPATPEPSVPESAKPEEAPSSRAPEQPPEDAEGDTQRLTEVADAMGALLLQRARAENLRVVLVTSAAGGAAKAPLACNLALALARAGQRTLLIDGDLRRPSAHQFFEQVVHPGFGEVLLREVELRGAWRPTLADARLFLLPAGQWDRAAVREVEAGRLQALFEELRKDFDFIVLIDAHPALPASEALLLVQHADAVLVARAGDIGPLQRASEPPPDSDAAAAPAEPAPPRTPQPEPARDGGIKFVTDPAAGAAARPANALGTIRGPGLPTAEVEVVDTVYAVYGGEIERVPDVDPTAFGRAPAASTGNGTVKVPKEDRTDVVQFRRAPEIDPNEAQAYLGLGNVFEKKGRIDEAIAAFRRATELDPGNALVHAQLGKALTDCGRLDEAVAANRQALTLAANLVPAHHNLGVALGLKGQFQQAVAAFRRALELDPNNAVIHANLGKALKDLGQLDEAMAECRQALALDPLLTAGHYSLGLCLQLAGRLDEAIAEYRRAIELTPFSAPAYSNLGAALQAKGQFDEAIASYRRAIELLPDFAEAHCHLGLALLRQAEFTSALDALRRGHTLGSRTPGWPHPSAHWVQNAERLAALDERLDGVLAGRDIPANAAERLEFALVCRLKQMHTAAVALFGQTFVADPTLADDLRSAFRYCAACSAIQAAADRDQDESERSRLRKQALEWLRADLGAWGAQMANGSPDSWRDAVEHLRSWLQTPDLRGLRDPDAIFALPEEEKRTYGYFWDSVSALLARAEPEPPDPLHQR